MSERLNVVIHAADGTLIKGSTQTFHPDRATFLVAMPNGTDTVPVSMADLKAVFFVKELEVAHPHPRQKVFTPTDSNRGNGRPVAVLFRDGELLVGYTHSYNPERQGFFMLPADLSDNNLRIFVVKKAMKMVKLGPAAEQFASAAKRASETAA